VNGTETTENKKKKNCILEGLLKIVSEFGVIIAKIDLIVLPNVEMHKVLKY
jgi:hypothetical protein